MVRFFFFAHTTDGFTALWYMQKEKLNTWHLRLLLTYTCLQCPKFHFCLSPDSKSWESLGTRIKYLLSKDPFRIQTIFPARTETPTRWERHFLSSFVQPRPLYSQPQQPPCAQRRPSFLCTVQRDHKWTLDPHSLLPRLSCLQALLAYNYAKSLPAQDHELELGKACKRSVCIWTGFVWLCVFGNKGQTGICFVETFQQHWSGFSTLLCPLWNPTGYTAKFLHITCSLLLQ